MLNRTRAERMAAAMRRVLDGGVPSWQSPVSGGEPRTDAACDNASSSGPGWLKFVPAEVRGLVRSHLPAFLHDGSGERVNSDDPPAYAGSVELRGARFLSRAFANDAGSRSYKLFVPACYAGQKVPLIVMLHGCTQSPDDFAAGTAMNVAAERETCIVAYPGQPKSEHAQKCWKWFSAENQGRDAGEPSIIAGITRDIMRDHAIDPRRVFVAGFSAGGAMAAIMGEAYPDLYAAVGVHSGLACGAASNLASALAAMKRGGGASSATDGTSKDHRSVATIVFHGTADATVSARNCDDIVARACGANVIRRSTEEGEASGGHLYTRSVHYDRAGRPVVEQWVIQGGGHAWAGGDGAGSFTDPRGPNATREMMRFFREHPRADDGSA